MPVALPAPAPTAAPAGGDPAPGSQPGAAPTDARADVNWTQDIEAEIDSLDDEHVPPPEPEGGEADRPPGKTKPAAKPDTGKTKPAPQPAAAEGDKTPSNIKDLRKGYEDQRKQIREHFTPTIARLEKELKELREAPQAVQTKQEQERVKALEARNTELEDEIRRVNFKKSKPYIEEYEKPYIEAWAKARLDLAEVEVMLPNGQTRKATDADIMQLAAMPLGAARRKAKEMFEDSADDIMFHVRRLSELSEKQEAAEAKAMQEAETSSQTKATEEKAAIETRTRLFDTANDELAKKYPLMFAPTEGDDRGNALLEKGFALSTLLYRPTTLTQQSFNLLPKFLQEDLKANKGKLSEQGRIRLDSLIFNKVANHDRQVARANRLEKELSKLKKDLKAYEDSEPGGRPAAPGGRGATSFTGAIEDANAEIDKMDNPNLG